MLSNMGVERWVVHAARATGVTTRGEGRLHGMLNADLEEDVLTNMTGKTPQGEEGQGSIQLLIENFLAWSPNIFLVVWVM